ncbi:ABC-type uncharacterized transport system substrate-binding protein [Rhizobium azooxidifex]|uniref:ABC-type uncharacterized transport system substrate-binding protein n=1 Tax=Mycoplana azooxidifex TaxID=1636188 RepID=A0A7W6D7G0_9HYPH|nr:DUF1007 family protein [Mycoplana azooxidifex]MBB3977452.1 ABC-type uncharacterized transport system substrate-binding protein [Mycoplana azooxidifex]
MKHAPLLIAGAVWLSPAAAMAHPHIFAEARLEVVAGDDGTVSELRNVWRFDEMFSSSVVLDFDKNSNLKLDPDELAEVGQTVLESLEEFSYYTTITEDGKDVKVGKPDAINVDFQDGQLLMFFTLKPGQAMPLKGKLTFGVYDPTMYASMDFPADDNMVVVGDRFSACKHQVVRPDPDEVLAQNEGTLTDAFWNDPTGTDMSRLFATRLEVTC